MTTRRSKRTVAGPSFRGALDPCLVLAPSDSNVTHHAKDKVKARAVNNEEGRQRSERYAKTATSRINSLDFVDSPRLQRNRHNAEAKLRRDGARELSGESSNSKSNESSNSTIESFGSKSTPVIVPLYDVLAAEKSRKAASDIRGKEQHAKDEFARRTSYGRKKRRRTERDDIIPAVSDSDADLPPNLKGGMDGPVPKEKADELWENIWGRWEQSMNQTVVQDEISTSTPHRPPDLITEQVEATLLASQTSQVSIGSQQGPLEAQFSFYRFESQEQLHSENPAAETAKAVEILEDTAETSRSRIDANLLCNDDEEEEETLIDIDSTSPLGSQRQRQVDAIYNEDVVSEMRAVKYFIFRGENVASECFRKELDESMLM